MLFRDKVRIFNCFDNLQLGSGKVKGTQTDTSKTECAGSCNCEEKYETEMTDLRLRLEKQYGAEKRRALKDMEERVR